MHSLPFPTRSGPARGVSPTVPTQRNPLCCNPASPSLQTAIDRISMERSETTPCPGSPLPKEGAGALCKGLNNLPVALAGSVRRGSRILQ